MTAQNRSAFICNGVEMHPTMIHEIAHGSVLFEHGIHCGG